MKATHDSTRNSSQNPTGGPPSNDFLWPFPGTFEQVEVRSWEISQCAWLLDRQLNEGDAGSSGMIARITYLTERLVIHAKALEVELYGEPRKEVWL